MASSRTIKENLAQDFLDRADVATYVLPYNVAPEELDNRDGFSDHAICIYEGRRFPNTIVGSNRIYEYVQEYIVMVYVRNARMKGKDANFEGFYDGLSDEVFHWIDSLSESNRIYTVSEQQLRVPNSKDSVTNFFTDKEEEISIGRHTYTRYHFETIRTK